MPHHPKKEREEEMNLCSDGHDEVCYEGRNCPVCIEIDNSRGLEKQIENLEEKISSLEKP